MTEQQADEELLTAVLETLMEDGRINKFKAELRATVMSALDRSSTDELPPEIPEETQLVNELIKEYLEWNGYRYTEQVLCAESGQEDNMSREDLSARLEVVDDCRTSKIPLLYFIVADFQKKEEMNLSFQSQ